MASSRVQERSVRRAGGAMSVNGAKFGQPFGGDVDRARTDRRPGGARAVDEVRQERFADRREIVRRQEPGTE